MRTLVLNILVGIFLLPMISGEVEKLKATVRAGHHQLRCLFTLVSEDLALDLNKSSARCSPKPRRTYRIPNVHVKGGSMMYTFTMYVLGSGKTLLSNTHIQRMSPTTADTTITLAEDFEAPWKCVGTSCFQFLPASLHGDIEFAKETCAKLSARLPTVNSQAVKNFLDQNTAPSDPFNYFIGAVKVVGGSWTWMDGTAWGYEDWRTSTGEPTGDGSCIGKWKEGWNDISCQTDMDRIICQKDSVPRYPLTFDWVDSENNQCWGMEPNGLSVSFKFNRFEITTKLGVPDDGWLTVSPSIEGVNRFCLWDDSTYCKTPNEKCISPPMTHTFPADETVKICYTALPHVSSSFSPPNNGESSSSSSGYPTDVQCWKNIASIGKSLKFELINFLHTPSDVGSEWIQIGNKRTTTGTTSIPHIETVSAIDMVAACFKSHPMDDGHSGFRVVLSQVIPLSTTPNQADTTTISYHNTTATDTTTTMSTTRPEMTTTSSTTTITTTTSGPIEGKCADVVHELAQFYLNYGPQNKTNSPEGCRALCKSVHDCVGWSWNTRSTDCWLKAAMVEDTHVSGERDCEPTPIPIYNSSGGYEFFKVPFANGTTLIDGSVAKTCQKVNMTAVCNGGFDSTCPGNSHICLVTDISIGCGNSVLDELSKHICNENDPRNCIELEGVFSYKKGWFGGECGVVNGSYCALGKNHVSGDPVVYQALCVDCQGANCSVNGVFDEWSSWSSCIATCMRNRSRSCTNPEPSNRGNGCVGNTYQEEPCINADCPPVYNTNQTAGNYTTCPDGNCAYCGGDCAPTFIDVASNSTQNITVQCCSAGGLTDTTHTCGNGTSCKDICGPSNSSCITIVGSQTAEESQICSDLMEEEDWCRSTTSIGELTGNTCKVGTRSIMRGNPKTRAIWSTPIYNINYCPRYVYRFMRNLGMMSNYKECCLHPTVYQHGILKKECSKYVGA